MEVKILNYGDDLWDAIGTYASECSWVAGPFLSKQMKEKRFTDWERILVAVDGSEICAYCTITKVDCIPDVSYSPYIGFMFVDERYRGNRLSEILIDKASEYAKGLGFKKVYLVSGEKGLYEKYGFIKIEEKKNYWGEVESIFSRDIK